MRADAIRAERSAGRRVGAFGPLASGQRSTARRLGQRLLLAAGGTVLACAVFHCIVLMMHSLGVGNVEAWNVFTMVELDRLRPELAAVRAAGLSWLIVLGVFGLVFVLLSWRDATRMPRPADSGHSNGSAATPASLAPIGMPARKAGLQWRPGLGLALAIAAAGVTIHMSGLALVERFVSEYPSVHDVLQASLPYVDFGLPGELAFAAFLVVACTLLIGRQPRIVSSVIGLLGMFYAIRGVFLFLLPIGSPPTAPHIADRFVFYPYPDHAFFPGGHAGIMTILSFAIRDRTWRRAMLGATAVFGFGTVLARTHYTADVLGGMLLGYALVGWARRNMTAFAPEEPTSSLWRLGRRALRRALAPRSHANGAAS